MVVDADIIGSRIGIDLLFLVNLTLIFFGLLLYHFNGNVQELCFLYVITLVLQLFLISTATHNLIFLSRLVLLFLVGAYPIAIKLIDSSYFFSVFEFNTQTLDIATKMYALTLIALPTSYFGWYAGKVLSDFCITPIPHMDISPAREPYLSLFFYVTGAIAIFSGLMVVSTSTGTIFSSSYGTGTEGSPLFGTTVAIGGVSLSVMFYCALSMGKKRYIFFVVCVGLYFLIWCQLLRGLRQDMLGSIFSMIIIYLMQTTHSIKFKIKYFLLGIPFYLFLELWGLMRTGLHSYLVEDSNITEVFNMGLGNAAKMDGVVYSGTLGPISTTFANMVYLINNKLISFLYGKSYFDYILRTPPEFLYPDRPKDYATIFKEYGLSSGGGFFELSEAYLNFGLLGVFILPLLISFIISCIYFYAKKGTGFYRIFALSSILCVWLRGAWYQTFAYYKSFIAATILFTGIYLLMVFVMQFKKIIKYK